MVLENTEEDQLDRSWEKWRSVTESEGGMKHPKHKVNNCPTRCDYIQFYYTGCFTTCGHYCSRWFPRSSWLKKSYKHVSNFGRLRSYGNFLIPVHALVWTGLRNQMAG